jgi:hypothetical protein
MFASYVVNRLPDLFNAGAALVKWSPGALSKLRLPVFCPISLSNFRDLVVNDLDFDGKVNINRVVQKPVEQRIPLGY